MRRRITLGEGRRAELDLAARTMGDPTVVSVDTALRKTTFVWQHTSRVGS